LPLLWATSVNHPPSAALDRLEWQGSGNTLFQLELSYERKF